MLYFESKSILKFALASWMSVWILGLTGTPVSAQDYPHDANDLAVSFRGGYGQLEIGGKYVGAEFHNSRPLPTRLSFYYPVANSIDQSTDYWQRHESQPMRVVLLKNGSADTVGTEPFSYHYTPFYAEFEQIHHDYRTNISYRFCTKSPAMVCQIRIKNLSAAPQQIELITELKADLRTCHHYRWIKYAELAYFSGGRDARVNFIDPETDSAQVFVLNAGALPKNRETATARLTGWVENPTVQFHYSQKIQPDSALTVIQVIGSCKQDESDRIIALVLENWQQDVSNYEAKVSDYAFQQSHFEIPEPTLQQTFYWSKTILAANQHYIDNRVVPMPCPAEYNFFFTHDALLTDLAAVFFDGERVKRDLLFLQSLTRADSLLPHAYYWRDQGFQTEFCGNDNWNHFWFIILASAYLKHSNDLETIHSLLPIIQKSLALVLQNLGPDTLIHARRPDWWDIGNVPGARAYHTILMIAALKNFCYLGQRLDFADAMLRPLDQLAEQLQKNLAVKLWDEKAGFLFSQLTKDRIDRHFYAGSLLASALQLLEQEKSRRLLASARRELLDSHLGIRNVMPADLHELIPDYQFNGMEAGGPFIYLNGGVWPHGNAWYALGLLAISEPDSALDFIRKYMTLAGIQASPNGQPAFFEYRNADQNSPRYGEIDKPTFLWAGGWYLYTLYHLAGMRETAWNIRFEPQLPENWREMAYDLLLFGQKTRIQYSGSGPYFKSIKADGKELYSAVCTIPAKTISLERGLPECPYLADTNCIIRAVTYNRTTRRLRLRIEGVKGQLVYLKLAAPAQTSGFWLNGKSAKLISTSQYNHQAWQIGIDFEIPDSVAELEIGFKPFPNP